MKAKRSTVSRFTPKAVTASSRKSAAFLPKKKITVAVDAPASKVAAKKPAAKKVKAATLVAAPARPKTRAVAVRNTKQASGTKRPSDPRENPAARDSRGTASRAEIRKENPRVPAPRASNRPVERRGQPRSRKAGSK